MKQILWAVISLFWCMQCMAQDAGKRPTVTGVITGQVLDADNGKALAAATVTVKMMGDTMAAQSVVSGKNGDFVLEGLAFGYYRLQIEMSGYNKLQIDSIYLRPERYDFNLNDIKLHKKNTEMAEVLIYAEKPLIENKDGKITFNVGESALSSGASATELLKQAPLVNVDNDGKVLLRGKETKILIDDKPVELSAKQLQDLLESMSGSTIEKIEVMTTPPPQYANERGGVINIVTKKGKVGKTARLNLSYGTRGEASVSMNFGYRKNKWAINASAGFGYSRFNSNSFSIRQNIYTDSTNYFNTNGQSDNLNNRPNARVAVDYDASKRNSYNITVQANGNLADNSSGTAYSTVGNLGQLYRLSNRTVASDVANFSPSANATWTHKFARAGEQLRIIAGYNHNNNQNDRDFYQQFLNPDYTPSGVDSTQQQQIRIAAHTLSLRTNYDRPMKGTKYLLNLGSNISRLTSHNTLGTYFMKKPENVLQPNALLSNDIVFHQNIYGMRAALRYNISEGFHINAGVLGEWTATNFELAQATGDYTNGYMAWLPFATMIKKWPNDFSITVSYKRTVQRPGINELNPGVDYTDPYNIRFGNPFLLPYYADNFDLIVGRWTKGWNINASVGYNALQDIYSTIRNLQADGKTTITWQNISGRREYEASTWGGITLNKKSKVNLSLGYTYNVYSAYDRAVNRFRNGGSFFSTLNGNYQFNDLLGSNASLTFNRFANPQGTVRSTLSMNLGIQQKLLKKRLTLSLNIIDPFRQQQNRNSTYGSNFFLQSVSATQTRNIRIGLGYNLVKPPVAKKVVKKVGKGK
jgi:Outer membrane protein beta-barrel family/Carboxypeptidase regulatory-like domain